MFAAILFLTPSPVALKKSIIFDPRIQEQQKIEVCSEYRDHSILNPLSNGKWKLQGGGSNIAVIIF